jgi:hypothetical protein
MKPGDLITPKDKPVRLECIVEDYYRFAVVDRGSPELVNDEGRSVFKFTGKPRDKTFMPGDAFALVTQISAPNGEVLGIQVLGVSESINICHKNSFRTVV